MTLRAAYADYLRAGALPSAAGALARALVGTPLAGTAALLDRYARQGAGTYSIAIGAHAGERAAVGMSLPDARPGALWLDVVDLSTNILLPAHVPADERDQLSEFALARAAANTQWFALEPVRRFQLHAFLDVAGFDDARDGDELAYVAMPPDLAAAYLYYVGKYATDAAAWRSARVHVPGIADDGFRALVPTRWGLKSNPAPSAERRGIRIAAPFQRNR